MITNLELQSKFNTATENSLNRNLLIENEIKEIENYVNNIPVDSYGWSALKKTARPSTIKRSPKIFAFGDTYIDRKIFNESFYEYLNNGKPITFERLDNDNDEMYRLKQNSADQAIEIFKYYEWLRIQLSNPQKTEEDNSMPIKQKLLVLHYLGMDTSEHNHTKCAEILAEVLGVGSENIRKSLSHLYAGKNNSVRTKNNLEKVKQLFDSQGLTKISNQIKDHLEKL